MRRLLLLLICGAMICGASWLSFSPSKTTASKQDPITVILPRNTGVLAIAKKLEEAGAIYSAYPFLILTFLHGKQKILKAGEYSIPTQASLPEILDMIATGKVIKHQLTIPEGFTVAQTVALLNANPILVGKISAVPPEGHLLPDTYEYVHGDTRQDLLSKIWDKMDKLLIMLWESRELSFPLKTPEEALILASIVEKETTLLEERSHMAGVFLNRLAMRMPLQADPTIIYALTKGQASLERALTYKDLRTPSPYNTYIHRGLPPTAIACPSKATLQAVLQPDPTIDLYFVADGKGGHVFTPHFPTHTQNVRNWRQISKGITSSASP